MTTQTTTTDTTSTADAATLRALLRRARIYVESAADDSDNPGNIAEKLLAEIDAALNPTA